MDDAFHDGKTYGKHNEPPRGVEKERNDSKSQDEAHGRDSG